MSYTENPTSEVLKLRLREQNIKFINYCPRCNDWMDQTNHNTNLMFSEFTCPKCKLIRSGKDNELMK